MDKLTACRILGISEDAGRAEIRKAYAELSKKYHPEEHPDEFQKIHEAYQALIRGAGRGGGAGAGFGSRAEAGFSGEKDTGRGSGTTAGRNAGGSADQRSRQWEQERQEKTQDGTSQDRTSAFRQEEARDRRGGKPQEDNLDFDRAVSAAQQREQEQLCQTVLKAAAEIQILLGPQYKYKLKLFKEFFKKEEYQTALKTSEFMETFAGELKKTDLKGIIYDYIIDYYRLKSVDRRQIHKGAGMLYDLLDQRRGIMKKRLGAQAFAIPAGAAVALRIVTRSAYRSSEAVGVLVWCALAVIGLVWLGRKLYENHSGVFAQFIIALILSAAQFFAVMFDFYAPAFGVDGGAAAAVIIMMLGICWMIALGIAALVLKIRSAARK